LNGSSEFLNIDADHPLNLVWAELQRAIGMLQLGVLLVCILIAWLVARRFVPQRADAADAAAESIKEALRGVLLAFFVWVLLAIARPLLGHWTGTAVLDLAAKLFGSLALARLMVFLARRAFPTSGVLATFEWAIATVIWGAFALHLTGLLPEISEFLDAIRLPVGKQTISFLTIIEGAFWVLVILLVALWIGSVIDARLTRTEALHSSLRVAVSRLVRATLIFVGVLIALPLVGIELTILSVFGGALGVGLGFGLQKIASNYVSGFIVLIERSIRIKDMVTVDNFYGEVRSLTTRYVVIRSLDGREAIIPNEKMITDTVINHSLNDTYIRVATQVQVPYDSDLDRVIRVLEDVASRLPRVLAEPRPAALVTKFADSGIDVELGFWIADPQNGAGGARAEVNLEIWRAFTAAGIEFAYPRQEVRILEPEPRNQGAQIG
jgi:small-conductance mechanosensitive channel